jgi:hypothetical protein
MTTTILLHGKQVSKEALTEFKKHYMTALKLGEDSFTYDGKPVLTAYAKYVVEYAESQLGTL